MFFYKIILVVSLANFLHNFYVTSCVPDCADPPVFTPPRPVVKYGDRLSASCSVCPTCAESEFDVLSAFGKTALTGSTIFWEVEEMTEWRPQTMCVYTDASGDECCTDLIVTVYKPPDNVFFSFVNHTGPISENRPYTLQCDVQDVAPIELLIVTFYRGRTPLIQLQPIQTAEKPVSETFYHHINSTEDDDDRDLYWCEAMLDLGPEGPQPPPVVASQLTPSGRPDIFSPLSSESLMMIILGGLVVLIVCIFIIYCFNKFRFNASI